MKHINEKIAYEAPEVEVLEVKVEQGFAQSGVPVPDYERGSDWGWN